MLDAPIPVLAETKEAFVQWQDAPQAVRGHSLTALLMDDPLAALRLFMQTRKFRTKRQLTEVMTVEGSIVWLGVERIFNIFSDAPTVEELLLVEPAAQSGFMEVNDRARKAAYWARDWCARRRDLEYDLVTLGALLHDLAELLVWVHAPKKALLIRAFQHQRRGRRSSEAQKTVLGFSYHELQMQLVKRWRLPQLLIDVMDDEHADQPRVKNVVLAANMARHCANGWDDPALPDDFSELARLLNITEARAKSMILPYDHEPVVSALNA